VLFILEAMKMETEIRTSKAGTVTAVLAREGDSVSVGDTLLTLA
jgi:oxaloacetate decarboxylase alpha subunit